MRHLTPIACCLAWLGSGCGQDPQATIAIRIHAAQVTSVPTRGFTPEDPPYWVRAEVVAASQLAVEGGDYRPAAFTQPVWDEMDTDPATGRRYLLLDVAPNQGKSDPYLLRVASLIPDELDRPVADACGVVGGIEAARGEKQAVDLVAHPGDCEMICANDLRCAGTRYCLSFECQLRAECTGDIDCPDGAWCDGTGCSGRCGDLLPACRSGYVCCAGVCALTCALD